MANDFREYAGKDYSAYLSHYGKGHDDNPPGRGSGRYPYNPKLHKEGSSKGKDEERQRIIQNKVRKIKSLEKTVAKMNKKDWSGRDSEPYSLLQMEILEGMIKNNEYPTGDKHVDYRIEELRKETKRAEDRDKQWEKLTGKRRYERTGNKDADDLLEFAEKNDILPKADIRKISDRHKKAAELSLKVLKEHDRSMDYDPKDPDWIFWLLFEDQTIGMASVADLARQGKSADEIRNILSEGSVAFNKADKLGDTKEPSFKIMQDELGPKMYEGLWELSYYEDMGIKYTNDLVEMAQREKRSK